jgi:hypothetical protein
MIQIYHWHYCKEQKILDFILLPLISSLKTSHIWHNFYSIRNYASEINQLELLYLDFSSRLSKLDTPYNTSPVKSLKGILHSL